MDNPDELLNIVNEHDKVIGTILRGDYQRLVKQKLGYLRAVDIFMVNDQGQLWIPRRAAHKHIAPNGLDYSAGGHVSAGETYLEACLHEIQEELGLKVSKQDLTFVHKFPPKIGRASCRERV